MNELKRWVEGLGCLEASKSPWGTMIHVPYPLAGGEHPMVFVEKGQQDLYSEKFKVTDGGTTLSNMGVRGFEVQSHISLIESTVQLYGLELENEEIFTHVEERQIRDAILRVVAASLAVGGLFALHKYKPYEMETPRELEETFEEWMEKREIRKRFRVSKHTYVDGKLMSHHVDFALRNGRAYALRTIKPHKSSFNAFLSFALDFSKVGKPGGIAIQPSRWSEKEAKILERIMEEGEYAIGIWEGPEQKEEILQFFDAFIFETSSPKLLIP